MALSVRLPEEIDQRLKDLAARTGRSRAYYIREAVIEHIQNMEDYYLAEEVMQRVRSGEEKIYSLEEMERELGLED